jgi:restriction system protein
MAEISSRRNGEMLRNLLQILQEQPDGLPSREALARLRAKIQLTDYEKGRFENGALRFDQIVRFATVDASKAGWLLKQKGQWIVTEQGRQALAQFPDPDAFFKRAKELYRQWRSSQPEGRAEERPEPAEVEAEKASEITFEQAEEQAWSEVEQYLRGMPPYDFQELVAALLRAMGYHVAWVAPPGKDGGIDILAWGDPLGTRPPRIKVQVKRVGQNVSVEGLRSFMALLGDDDVGLFVTTSGFTKDAQEEARTQEKRKVTLVDLERFFDLWVEHYGRLDEAARRRFPLQPSYFLAPRHLSGPGKSDARPPRRR